MLAGPVDEFVLSDVEEQIELLGKERIVVPQFVSKQWARLDEGTASGDHFRPALREKIQGGEILKHSNGIRCAQDRHGAG